MAKSSQIVMENAPGAKEAALDLGLTQIGVLPGHQALSKARGAVIVFGVRPQDAAPALDLLRQYQPVHI